MFAGFGHLWIIMNARTLCLLGTLGVYCGSQARSELPNPFRKGRFFVSTAASWKTQDYDLKDTKTWNLEPVVGYFVKDNLAVGLGGVIGLHAFDYVQDNTAIGSTTFEDEDTNWGALGPMVRGHIGGPRISAFGQIGAYFGSIDQTSVNNRTTNGSVANKVQQGGFQLYDFGAGIAYYFKGMVGIEFMGHYYLGYAQTTTDITYDTGEQINYAKSNNNADGGGASIGLVVLFGLAKGQAAAAPAN